MIKTLAVLDISETGSEIAQKLFVLLDEQRKRELLSFLLSSSRENTAQSTVHPVLERSGQRLPFTEIRSGALYVCIEERKVILNGVIIGLTVKEFDILALLIMNPKRVFTFEVIHDMVWEDPYDWCGRKAISTQISNLRRKLRDDIAVTEKIKGVHNVGYKFDGDVEITTH